jgi:hypothetical protein
MRITATIQQCKSGDSSLRARCTRHGYLYPLWVHRNPTTGTTSVQQGANTMCSKATIPAAEHSFTGLDFSRHFSPPLVQGDCPPRGCGRIETASAESAAGGRQVPHLNLQCNSRDATFDDKLHKAWERAPLLGTLQSGNGHSHPRTRVWKARELPSTVFSRVTLVA